VTLCFSTAANTAASRHNWAAIYLYSQSS